MFLSESSSFFKHFLQHFISLYHLLDQNMQQKELSFDGRLQTLTGAYIGTYNKSKKIFCLTLSSFIKYIFMRLIITWFRFFT